MRLLRYDVWGYMEVVEEVNLTDGSHKDLAFDGQRNFMLVF